MLQRLFSMLSLLVMVPAFSQERPCSPSDFQSCKTCAQLEIAIDLKNPNTGDYYRGAEWNGLYAAYVLNCQLVAAKLLNAGANPSSGGTSGSMVMTVSGAWPHNNKKTNEEWAILLLASGANVNTPLNWRDGKSTRQVMMEETWFTAEYPDLLSLFNKSSAATQIGNRSGDSEAIQSAKTEDKDIVFTGQTLRYPKGATEEEVVKAAPYMKCTDFSGSRVCTAEVKLLQREMLKGLPGSCIGGKELVVVFNEHGRVESVSCDIPQLAADTVFIEHLKKFGDPKIETFVIGGMRTNFMEWIVGDDYVLLSNHTGHDFNGRALNNFTVQISAKPSITEKIR